MQAFLVPPTLLLAVAVTAPLLGMLLAAEAHVRLMPARHVHCAKLNHAGDGPDIFICEGRP